MPRSPIENTAPFGVDWVGNHESAQVLPFLVDDDETLAARLSEAWAEPWDLKVASLFFLDRNYEIVTSRDGENSMK